MSRPLHGGNLNWAAGLAGCSPGEVLDFSASINPLGPPASALAAIQAHLNDLKSYPDPACLALRQVLSQIHQIPVDWIMVGNGSAELLTWACRDLAQLPTTHLLVPAFGDYRRALSAFSASVTTHLLALDKSQTWQIPIGSQDGLLLNSPHNPTGLLLDRDRLQSYLEQCGLLVLDEAFMDFLPPTEQQTLVDWVMQHKNLVILRSLTKFYSIPGLRLGYAVAHPDHLQRWQQWRDPWSVNVLASAVGIAVLQDTHFQQQTWDWLPEARSQLFTGLQQLSGLEPHPGVANFLLVKTAQSATALQRVLLEVDRILIRDCLSFPELGDGYFRVAVRTSAENQRLLEALVMVLPSLPLADQNGV